MLSTLRTNHVLTEVSRRVFMPPSRATLFNARAMSAAATGNAPPQRHKFLVYAPDMTDPDALHRRLSVRPAHLERANGEIAKGVIKLGGAMLTPESIASRAAEKKMVGSVFVCEAESLDAVRGLMESDVYYTSGVWDKEKMVILPLALATELP
ncbi:hypothetical protein C8Q77DRAFT_1148102 [Trametes polyzona]|nr:hypothetical protein C8Q77DRAFT_1148102 [Trametes polyzona]